MKFFLVTAALLMMSSEAMAQRCGSMNGGACVTCCQGTGRSASTCQYYSARSASEKKAAASKDFKRTQCLARAGISAAEASSVSRRDPRHAAYHSCMGR